jgi:3-oxoacyl-[acyl-carrier-protein] synthase II
VLGSVEVVVTGIGLVSALGSLESSWHHLLDGKSAIRLHQPFPDLPSRPLGLIGQTTASLENLIKQSVMQAIQDANLSLPLPDCGVVIGSSRSYQASWEQLASLSRGAGGAGGVQELGEPCLARFGTEMSLLSVHASLASYSHSSMPNLANWLDMLPHSAAIAAARHIGSTSPVLAPMAACATGIWAIARGFELIQMGRCQRVIVGAVEAPITPLTLIGFEKMGALAKTGAYPFDKRREGLVLGEAAAILVLESADLALARTAPVYGTLLGFGLTNDGYHVSAPATNQRSAIAAIEQCLKRSNLSPSEISYIHAHGTSTQLNDQNEAQVIQRVFERGVPVSSTKGATGHTLGASGALGAAFCLKALKHQLLPPCVGLQEPDFELDFVKTPRRGDISAVLCLCFGFGGQNAVLAWSRTSA